MKFDVPGCSVGTNEGPLDGSTPFLIAARILFSISLPFVNRMGVACSVTGPDSSIIRPDMMIDTVSPRISSQVKDMVVFTG